MGDVMGALSELGNSLSRANAIPTAAVGRVLAQCLHQALRCGVHRQALALFSVLSKNHSDSLFQLLYSALTLGSRINAVGRGDFLKLFDISAQDAVLPEETERNALTAVVTTLLPLLTTDAETQVKSLIECLMDKFGCQTVLSCVWRALYVQPMAREAAAVYLRSAISERVERDGESSVLEMLPPCPDHALRALSAALHDSDERAIRETAALLDLFPASIIQGRIDSQAKKIQLFTQKSLNSLGASVLLRLSQVNDGSVKRHLQLWLLSSDELVQHALQRLLEPTFWEYLPRSYLILCNIPRNLLPDPSVAPPELVSMAPQGSRARTLEAAILDALLFALSPSSLEGHIDSCALVEPLVHFIERCGDDSRMIQKMHDVFIMICDVLERREENGGQEAFWNALMALPRTPEHAHCLARHQLLPVERSHISLFVRFVFNCAEYGLLHTGNGGEPWLCTADALLRAALDRGCDLGVLAIDKLMDECHAYLYPRIHHTVMILIHALAIAPEPLEALGLTFTVLRCVHPAKLVRSADTAALLAIFVHLLEKHADARVRSAALDLSSILLLQVPRLLRPAIVSRIVGTGLQLMQNYALQPGSEAALSMREAATAILRVAIASDACVLVTASPQLHAPATSELLRLDARVPAQAQTMAVLLQCRQQILSSDELSTNDLARARLGLLLDNIVVLNIADADRCRSLVQALMRQYFELFYQYTARQTLSLVAKQEMPLQQIDLLVDVVANPLLRSFHNDRDFAARVLVGVSVLLDELGDLSHLFLQRTSSFGPTVAHSFASLAFVGVLGAADWGAQQLTAAAAILRRCADAVPDCSMPAANSWLTALRETVDDGQVRELARGLELMSQLAAPGAPMSLALIFRAGGAVFQAILVRVMTLLADDTEATTLLFTPLLRLVRVCTTSNNVGAVAESVPERVLALCAAQLSTELSPLAAARFLTLARAAILALAPDAHRPPSETAGTPLLSEDCIEMLFTMIAARYSSLTGIYANDASIVRATVAQAADVTGDTGLLVGLSHLILHVYPPAVFLDAVPLLAAVASTVQLPVSFLLTAVDSVRMDALPATEQAMVMRRLAAVIAAHALPAGNTTAIANKLSQLLDMRHGIRSHEVTSAALQLSAVVIARCSRSMHSLPLRVRRQTVEALLRAIEQALNVGENYEGLAEVLIHVFPVFFAAADYVKLDIGLQFITLLREGTGQPTSAIEAAIGPGFEPLTEFDAPRRDALAGAVCVLPWFQRLVMALHPASIALLGFFTAVAPVTDVISLAAGFFAAGDVFRSQPPLLLAAHCLTPFIAISIPSAIGAVQQRIAGSTPMPPPIVCLSLTLFLGMCRPEALDSHGEVGALLQYITNTVTFPFCEPTPAHAVCALLALGVLVARSPRVVLAYNEPLITSTFVAAANLLRGQEPNPDRDVPLAHALRSLFASGLASLPQIDTLCLQDTQFGSSPDVPMAWFPCPDLGAAVLGAQCWLDDAPQPRWDGLAELTCDIARVATFLSQIQFDFKTIMAGRAALRHDTTIEPPSRDALP